MVAYLHFHYGRGLRELLGVAQNLLWFILHFFSIKLLFRTLFAPWHRLGEAYGSIINFEAFFSVFIVNILMRLVGFVTRSVVIVMGLIAYVVTFVGSVAMFLVWVFAPILFVGMLVLSITFFAI